MLLEADYAILRLDLILAVNEGMRRATLERIILGWLAGFKRLSRLSRNVGQRRWSALKFSSIQNKTIVQLNLSPRWCSKFLSESYDKSESVVGGYWSSTRRGRTHTIFWSFNTSCNTADVFKYPIASLWIYVVFGIHTYQISHYL